jgi:hypothetical protein
LPRFFCVKSLLFVLFLYISSKFVIVCAAFVLNDKLCSSGHVNKVHSFIFPFSEKCKGTVRFLVVDCEVLSQLLVWTRVSCRMCLDLDVLFAETAVVQLSHEIYASH